MHRRTRARAKSTQRTVATTPSGRHCRVWTDVHSGRCQSPVASLVPSPVNLSLARLTHAIGLGERTVRARVVDRTTSVSSSRAHRAARVERRGQRRFSALAWTIGSRLLALRTLPNRVHDYVRSGYSSAVRFSTKCPAGADSVSAFPLHHVGAVCAKRYSSNSGSTVNLTELSGAPHFGARPSGHNQRVHHDEISSDARTAGVPSS